MPGRRSSAQNAYNLAMETQKAEAALKKAIREDNKRRKELEKLRKAAAEKKGGRTRSKRSSKRGTRRN